MRVEKTPPQGGAEECVFMAMVLSVGAAGGPFEGIVYLSYIQALKLLSVGETRVTYKGVEVSFRYVHNIGRGLRGRMLMLI